MKLSAEGDLVLGQQATDKDGYLLYYVDRAQNDDLAEFTTNPEEATIAIRDIEMVYQEDAELQLIRNRVQTDNPDWLLYPEVGADLSDLIGEINRPETAEKGIQTIKRCLTYDGAFKEEDVTIEAVPVSSEELLFDIRLERPSRFIRYALVFSFEVGLMNAFEVK